MSMYVFSVKRLWHDLSPVRTKGNDNNIIIIINGECLIPLPPSLTADALYTACSNANTQITEGERNGSTI